MSEMSAQLAKTFAEPIPGYSPMMVVRFQKTFPLRVNEWFLSAVLLLWGLILIQPDDIFSTNPIYAGLAHIAREETWAAACLVFGALRLTMLTVNGAWRPSPHIRAIMAFLSCFFWMQIIFGLIASGITSTGLAVYPMLLLLDVYSVYRAASDARIADERAKSKKLLTK